MKLFKQNSAKYLILLFISIITIVQFFVVVEKANAATVCAKATVHVVARDQNGAVIPGISYEISEPTTNSDGQIRPGKVVSSGKIDAILGEGKSIFTPTSGNYVVKMYDKSSSYGAFYFYNQLTAACGEEKIFTGTLSGLLIELRDTNGTVRKNTAFTISQQARNAAGQLIEQKGETVATLNSGVSGQKVIYLADDSHTVDQAPANYVFSSKGYGASEFVLYGISLNNGRTREINYVFSDVLIKFKDKNKNILPSGTKVEFLTQKSDLLGRVVADKLIKVLTIDSDGYMMFEYPAGYYFARIKKTNSEYYNFTDIKLADQARTSLTLDVLDDSAGQAACDSKSTLNVVARNASGDYIAGIKFELYEKTVDANNLPAAGALLAKGVTNNSGNGLVSIKPNPGKTYILKMYDKNANIGAFWYYDDMKFNCGENKNITKNLSSITLTARDIAGNLLKDYNFSLYSQKKDMDNNILKIKDYLVANIKTNAYGQATVYVSGGDPTQYQDTVRYLISIKYNNGMIFDQPDISLTAGADTKVNYALSGLSLTVVDAANNILSKGTNVIVYEQKLDINKKKILGKQITKLSLDNYSKAVSALTANTYVLMIKDKAGNLMNFWDIKIQNGLLDTKTITVPLVRVYGLDGAGKSISKASVYVYSLTKNSDGWYQKNKNIYRTSISNLKYADIILAAGQYLVTVKQGNSEFGVAIDLKNSSLKTVYISMKSGNLVKPESVYRITNANTSSTVGTDILSSSALADRLKGYVLLQVESNGEAWYLNPKDKKRYYMQNGAESFATMRSLGVGVTDSDLSKIPVGVLPMEGEADCDSDGLPDSLERAIGTEVCDNDSDGDGYSDYVEVIHNYNPLGAGKLGIDLKLAAKLRGALLLQVDSNEEIWYVNPRDNKRYYIPDNNVGFKIMKYLSLGITNANLNLIEEAK